MLWSEGNLMFLNSIYMVNGASQVALVVKNPPANAQVQSLGGGHSNPLQYSVLENPTDEGAWWATIHRVAKSQTWLKRPSMHSYANCKLLPISWVTVIMLFKKKRGGEEEKTEQQATHNLQISALQKPRYGWRKDLGKISVQQVFNTFYPCAPCICDLTLFPFPISPTADKRKQS